METERKKKNQSQQANYNTAVAFDTQHLIYNTYSYTYTKTNFYAYRLWVLNTHTLAPDTNVFLF